MTDREAVRVREAGGDDHAVVEGSAGDLVVHDDARATLTIAGGPDGGVRAHRVLLGRPRPSHVRRGVLTREVVVDGWRIDVEVEPERHAALRDLGRRAGPDAAHGGPAEVRAIIPGVVIEVSVVAGDTVTAGQQLLVVEAMKMQNELRAPRDGRVGRVAVGAGERIEVGALLVVVE